MPKRFNSLSMAYLLVAVAFFVPALFAQPVAQTTVSSNRFLFVVDTSSAMKKPMKEVAQMVGDTINSGANGQMRRGDTLGLWTFSEEVASELPIQRWEPSARTAEAFRTMDFLQRHAYAKSSRVESFLPDLLGLIKHSDVIMVFIISNGDGKIKGTPFDAEINASYDSAIRDMHGQRSPIVTILVAKAGNILHYTVNPLPWPIVIPELPPSPPVATAASKPQPTTPAPIPAPKPPPVTVPSLIVIGKHAAETADIPETNTTKPIIVESVRPAPIPPASLTSNAPTEITKGTTEAPVETNKPQTAVVPVPVPTPAPEPPPAVAMTNSTPPEKSPSLTAATANSLTNRAMAFVAPEKGGRSHALLIAAFGLILVALALIAVMVRRSRVTTGPSLITASLRHEKKDR